MRYFQALRQKTAVLTTVTGIAANDSSAEAAARRLLEEAGVYGVQVTVHHADPAKVAYPKYFANLIVSSESLEHDLDDPTQQQVRRMQRPYGGKTCMGRPGEMKVHTRGELAGAGSWTHQNSNAANTVCSMDRLVKGTLRMFWFRPRQSSTVPNPKPRFLERH